MGVLSDKAIKALATEAGVTVVAVQRSMHPTHVKVRCEHHGYHFFVTVSAHANGRDQKWHENVVGDFRKARKAVEQQDPALMKKYLGSRSAICSNTASTKTAAVPAATPSKSSSRK